MISSRSKIARLFGSLQSTLDHDCSKICGAIKARLSDAERASIRSSSTRSTFICDPPMDSFHITRRQFHLTGSRAMFIQVEETPNPNSLKFYPGETVLETGTADFQDKVQASLKSPLAKAIFRINGVKSVFFASNFITVSKEDDEKIEWNVLKPQIFSAIMIFYTLKQPILYSSLDKDPNLITDEDSDIVKEIKEIIKDRIRPTIQEDGGDLEFVSFEDNIVRVRLQGACTSCPSSVVTLKNGIRNMLQYYVPEVQDVEQVVDE